MLAFARIPTSATANKGNHIDEVKSRIVTSHRGHRDRSRHRNRPGYTLKSGAGCLTIGVHLSDDDPVPWHERVGGTDQARDESGDSVHRAFARNWPVAYADEMQVQAPNTVVFLHMILLNSDTRLSMSLGETAIISETGCGGSATHPPL